MKYLLLTIDDAVDVAMNYISNHCTTYRIDKEDRECLYREMEQKCWLGRPIDDGRKELVGYIADVNPAEICSQIENDNLSQWCETWQVNAQLALMKV